MSGSLSTGGLSIALGGTPSSGGIVPTGGAAIAYGGW
jgi:hypothetical protein